jgi:hypothetical protein
MRKKSLNLGNEQCLLIRSNHKARVGLEVHVARPDARIHHRNAAAGNKQFKQLKFRTLQ